MELAIVGSPSFEDYARFTKRVEEVLAERGIMMSEVQVISCGADALAARYSREVLGKEPHIFTADWKQFGRSAGAKRDDQIVEAADLVIAFPGKGRYACRLLTPILGTPQERGPRTPVFFRVLKELG
jgi:hypothetical protein